MHQPDAGGVGHPQRGDEQGEQRIVDDHHSQEDEAHGQLDHHPDEVRRRAVGHEVHQLGPHRQVARETVREELHRQPEQTRHELLGVYHREAHSQPVETPLLQPGEQVGQRPGRHRGRDQEASPLGLLRPENPVDEHAQQHRQGQARHGQQQPARGREGQRDLHLPQPGPQLADDPGPGAARLEAGPGFEHQHDAGERPAELLCAHCAPAVGGIIQAVAVSPEPFEHHEVVELPKQDGRQPHLTEGVDRLAPAGRSQAVALGRGHDVGR